MKDEHIKDMLDAAPFASFGESELAAMRSHADSCAECGRAYQAARVSASMLRERASQIIEPSPFFQTRVLAALRERQSAGEAWSLGRLWKAAGLLVSSMALTVAALAALAFVAPQQATMQQVASASDTYAAEDVIFNQDMAADGQSSYDQVLATLYGADDGAEK